LLLGAAVIVIRELQGNRRRVGAQVCHDRLEIVLLPAAHAKRLTLDAGIHLQLQVLDLLLDRLGRVLVDAALELDLLADRLVGRLLDLLRSSDLGSTPRFTMRSTSTLRTVSSCGSPSAVTVSSLSFRLNSIDAAVPLKS
jgi:hypothetical protein